MSDEDANKVVRLVVHNRKIDAPKGREFKTFDAKWPVVPAEPGWSLWTYFADTDDFGSSPIVAWRVDTQGALPVSVNCQVKGAATAIVRADGKVLGARWFANVDEWKRDIREKAVKEKAAR